MLLAFFATATQDAEKDEDLYPFKKPSLQKESINYHKRQNHIMLKGVACRDKVINELQKSTGIDVKDNKHSDFIFNDDVEKANKKFLEKNIGKDSIAEYDFTRAYHNHRIAKKKGVTSIRHCPLMICLGAIVCQAQSYLTNCSPSQERIKEIWSRPREQLLMS